MMVKLRKLKLMPLIVAGVLLVAGIVVLGVSYGAVTESAFAIGVGTLIFGVGAARLVYGFLTYKDELDARNNITLGVLDAVWGVMMLVLNSTTNAFLLLFGLWCIIAAVLETVEIVRNAVEKRRYIHLLPDAIINAIFGIIMMIANSIQGDFSIFVGVYLVLNALSSIMITVISVPGAYRVVLPTEAKVEEKPAVVEEAPVVETPVEEVPAKPAAKKTTTTRKTTATKSTATKSTTAKKPVAKKAPAKKAE